MVRTKGTDMVALKRILEKQGAEAMQAFLAKLSPELTVVYRGIVATSWTPVEQQMAIYQAAASVLFPAQEEPMEALGYTLAQESFGGVYRLFLRIPTIQFIMKRVANVWRSYYEKGDAGVENVGPNSLDFVVRGFPELPQPMLIVAKGHSRFLVEATGARGVRVDLDAGDPRAWRWSIRWR